MPIDNSELREKKQRKKGSMKEVEGSKVWIEGVKEEEEERNIFSCRTDSFHVNLVSKVVSTAQPN
jgi:hypothetical protein